MKRKYLLLSSISVIPLAATVMLASSCATKSSAAIKPSDIKNDNQLAEYQDIVKKNDTLAKEQWNIYSELNNKKSSLLQELEVYAVKVKDLENNNLNNEYNLQIVKAQEMYYQLAAGKTSFPKLSEQIQQLPSNSLNDEIKNFLKNLESKEKFIIPEISAEEGVTYDTINVSFKKATAELSGAQDLIKQNKIAIENIEIELKATTDKYNALPDGEEKDKLKAKIESLQNRITERQTTKVTEINNKIAAAEAKLEKAKKFLGYAEAAMLKISFANDSQGRQAELDKLKSDENKINESINAINAKLVIANNELVAKKQETDAEIAKFSANLQEAYNKYTKYADLVKDAETNIYIYQMDALDKTYNDKLQGTQGYLSLEQVKKIISPDYTFSNSPVGDKIAKTRVYQRSFNSSFSLSSYPADFSASYGGRVASSTIDSTTLSFVSLETLGRPIIKNTEETIIDENGVTQKKTQAILSPEIQRYKLELADAIYVYVDNGKVDEKGQKVYDIHVFDSDDAGLVPVGDNPDGTYRNTVVKRTSSNPRSINSKEFMDLVSGNNVVKFSFRIRPGQFWVNAQGQRTQYPITSEDFYTSIVRTMMNDTKYRNSNGGSKYIDEEVRKLLISPDKAFVPDAQFPNQYLYKMYNVNWDQMLDKDKTVVQAPNPENKDVKDDLFVIGKYDNAKTDFMQLLETISINYDFVPAPSTYIKDMTLNNTEDIYSQVLATKNDTTLYNTIVKAVKSASGQARESGIYWYGFNPQTTLFAGKYYAKPYDSETFSLSQYLNPYYFDTTYTGSNQTLLKLTTAYQQSPIDPETYSNQTYYKYLSGGIAEYPFDSLTKNNKQAALKDPKAYGLSYQQILAKDSLLKAFMWRFMPQASKKAYMSDAFAYTMYGTSVKELMEGTAKNTVPYTTLGIGGEFRNIISSAISWASFANQLSPNNPSYPWISAFAPDANLKPNDDVDDKSLDTNSLRPNHDIINGTFVVDSATGQRVVFDKINSTFLKPSDTQNLNVTAQDASKSIVYEQMKERMKALLDRVYEAHPELVGTKVSMDIMWSYTNITQARKQGYKDYAAAINGLDSRLDFRVVEFEAQKRDEWFSYWLQDTTPFTRASWGYDYDGLGSGITGYASRTGLVVLMITALVNQEYADKLKIAYPQLYKATQAFAKYIQQPTQMLSVSMEDIANLTTAELNKMDSWLGKKKYETQANGEKAFVDLKENEAVNFTKLSDLNAKFWLEYTTTKDITKKDLLDLAQEISNIVGAIPDMFYLTASKSPFAKRITNPNYIIPVTYNGFDDVTNYRVVKEDNK
ncbi:OppA family ABC transporter substrate-binding lipoprotein [Mycoplasma sp. Z463D]